MVGKHVVPHSDKSMPALHQFFQRLAKAHLHLQRLWTGRP
jgi:hypothetical protein